MSESNKVYNDEIVKSAINISHLEKYFEIGYLLTEDEQTLKKSLQSYEWLEGLSNIFKQINTNNKEALLVQQFICAPNLELFSANEREDKEEFKTKIRALSYGLEPNQECYKSYISLLDIIANALAYAKMESDFNTLSAENKLLEVVGKMQLYGMESKIFSMISS
jgi:hypothetical protein